MIRRIAPALLGFLLGVGLEAQQPGAHGAASALVLGALILAMLAFVLGRRQGWSEGYELGIEEEPEPAPASAPAAVEAG